MPNTGVRQVATAMAACWPVTDAHSTLFERETVPYKWWLPGSNQPRGDTGRETIAYF